jgi:dynein assembly factor 1, axonemal
MQSIEELKECPELHTLDLRKNHIEDPAVLDDVLSKLENLAVLYVNNNEFKVKIKNYRKMMVIKIKNLDHLDDRPVFEKERRLAEAFAIGDKEAEVQEKAVYNQEQEEKEEERRQNFQKVIDQGRQEWKDREQNKIETKLQSKLTMKEMLA